MLIDKWKFDGKDVVSEWLDADKCKNLNLLTHVYGVCFTKEGKVLIVKDLKDWKLPGGTPEKNESFEETLKREVFEEATVVLGNCSLIGCQKNKIERKINYQLRYAAIIEEIKEKDCNLSVSTYKDYDYEEKVYEKPEVLKRKILELEKEIVDGLEELKI